MNPILIIRNVLSSLQILSEIIREVKWNKKKCQQLGERIETIRETLIALQETILTSEEIENTLNGFCRVIAECTNFVKKFVDVPRYKRVYARRTYSDEFERYDSTLSNYNNLLQLDIEITMKINLNEIIDTISKNQDVVNEYTFHLAAQIKTLDQTHSINAENIIVLSNRMDMITTTLNELVEGVSHLTQIVNLCTLKTKQNIEADGKIGTQMADRNKTHVGIFRKSCRRVKHIFKK